MKKDYIRTKEDLQQDVNRLKAKEDLLIRSRKEINSNLKDIRLQVDTLEEMILSANQYEMF